MTVWALRVEGRPAPKGSMKCIGARGRLHHQLVESDDGGHGRRWRKTLTEAAALLAGKLEDGGEGGVIVGVLTLLERPAAARNRPLPTTRNTGDTDKHLRQVLDAGTGAGVYFDDSRVILTIAAKVYADTGPPGAIVYVAPVGEDPRRVLGAMLAAAPALHPSATSPTLI